MTKNVARPFIWVLTMLILCMLLRLEPVAMFVIAVASYALALLLFDLINWDESHRRERDRT